MKRLKNVSGSTLVIGDLKVTWSPNRIIDLDELDQDKLIKAFSVIEGLLQQGKLVVVDEKDRAIKDAESPKKQELLEKRRQKIKDMIQLVEFEYRMGDEKFDQKELKNFGEKYILRGKVTLRGLLELPHSTILKMLKDHDWAIEDFDELRMIHRHAHTKKVKQFLYQKISRMRKQLGASNE